MHKANRIIKFFTSPLSIRCNWLYTFVWNIEFWQVPQMTFQWYDQRLGCIRIIEILQFFLKWSPVQFSLTVTIAYRDNFCDKVRDNACNSHKLSNHYIGLWIFRIYVCKQYQIRYKLSVKFDTLWSSDFLLRLMTQSNDAVESLDKEMTEECYKYTYFHEKKTFQVT